MFTDLKFFFTGRHSTKFVKTWLLKSSPYPKCVATLPCDFSLIMTLVWECHLFSDIDVLQGSVATRIIRCGGIFSLFARKAGSTSTAYTTHMSTVLPSCLCAERRRGAPAVLARWRSRPYRWRTWPCVLRHRLDRSATAARRHCAAGPGDASVPCSSRIAARRPDTRTPCPTPATRNSDVSMSSDWLS